MLTGNIGILLASTQILILLILFVCGGYFAYKKYKERQEANWVKDGKAIIEKLPNGIHEGFGFIKDGQVLLRRNGVPYLFPSYPEALEYQKRFTVPTKVVYQNWDMDSKMVFVGKVNNGPEK